MQAATAGRHSNIKQKVRVLPISKMGEQELGAENNGSKIRIRTVQCSMGAMGAWEQAEKIQKWNLAILS